MAQYQTAVSNQVSYLLTEQQYQKSMWLHMKHRTWRVIASVCIALVVVFGLVNGAATAFVMGAFFAVYLGFIMWMLRRNIGNMYRSMPQLNVEQTLQFSEDGLVFHNAYALAKVKWQLFQKFDVDENVYLLYQGPNLFNVIPRSAFQSEAQEEAFRMLLEINVRPAKTRGRKRSR